MPSRYRTADVWLQIEGTSLGNTYDTGTQAVVRNATNREPAVILPGCIVVRIKVRIPAAAWEPFEAAATIDIPDSLIQREIAVEGVEP